MVIQKYSFAFLAAAMFSACAPSTDDASDMKNLAEQAAVKPLQQTGTVENTESDHGLPVELIKANIALFDELRICAANTAFARHGISAAGPCGDWSDRIRAQKAVPQTPIFEAGLECIAGNVEMVGMSLLRPEQSSNQEHIAWVEQQIDACRKAIE